MRSSCAGATRSSRPSPPRSRPLLLTAAHLPLSGAAVLPDDAPPGEDGPRPLARSRRPARGGSAPRAHRLEPAPDRGGGGAEPCVPGEADGGRPRRARAAPADARRRVLDLLLPRERRPDGTRGLPGHAANPDLRRARPRGVAPAAAVRARAGDAPVDPASGAACTTRAPTPALAAEMPSRGPHRYRESRRQRRAASQASRVEFQP